DALRINTHRVGLTHLHVVERREGVGHAQVKNVRVGAGEQLQIRVGFDGFKVVGADVGDHVDRASLQLQQTSSAFGAPTEYGRFRNGRFAPISIKTLEDDGIATDPFIEYVGTGANGMFQDLAGTASFGNPLRRLNAKRREGDFGQESRVGLAQVEDNFILASGFDGADLAAVIAVFSSDRHQFAALGF